MDKHSTLLKKAHRARRMESRTRDKLCRLHVPGEALTGRTLRLANVLEKRERASKLRAIIAIMSEPTYLSGGWPSHASGFVK